MRTLEFYSHLTSSMERGYRSVRSFFLDQLNKTDNKIVLCVHIHHKHNAQQGQYYYEKYENISFYWDSSNTVTNILNSSISVLCTHQTDYITNVKGNHMLMHESTTSTT